jgi:hypothetical protein
LRHGTNPNYKPKEDWLSEPQKQSSDGKLTIYTWFWSKLTLAQPTRQTPAFSRNSLHTTPILPRLLHIPPSVHSTAHTPN